MRETRCLVPGSGGYVLSSADDRTDDQLIKFAEQLKRLRMHFTAIWSLAQIRPENPTGGQPPILPVDPGYGYEDLGGTPRYPTPDRPNRPSVDRERKVPPPRGVTSVLGRMLSALRRFFWKSEP